MTSVAEHQGPILLFDGVCNLCTGSVQFVIKRDPQKRFRFASLQSPVARELLGKDGLSDSSLDSVILLMNGRKYDKSTAALLTAKELNGLWPLMAGFLIVPKPIRDAVYDWIGRRRYKYFGRQKVCWVPTQELQDRFLD